MPCADMYAAIYLITDTVPLPNVEWAKLRDMREPASQSVMCQP